MPVSKVECTCTLIGQRIDLKKRQSREGTMQIEPLMPDIIKGRDQTKKDLKFTPCAREKQK